MQVSGTTIVLGAAALGAVFALIISLLRRRGGAANGRASRRSHILSASALLLMAICAFVDAAVGSGDRYVLIGIGVVLVVTSVVVLFNSRERTTQV